MKQLLNAIVFFMVGFIAGGSSAAQAADIHDILGIIVGVGVINEVLDDRREHREHHDEKYRQQHELGDYAYSIPRRHRPRYQGDIHDAYRRHFPCGQQYTGYRGCRRIIDGDRTIIIIER